MSWRTPITYSTGPSQNDPNPRKGIKTLANMRRATRRKAGQNDRNPRKGIKTDAEQ